MTDQYDLDRAETLRNRERLSSNRNLVYWYRRLYEDQFSGLSDPAKLEVLEIGSGVSPLKRIWPSVKTSDVLKLDYLDYVFDCHEIDEVCEIADESLDVITLTNVLHHLREPIVFMEKAARKLKPGGRIIATEPHFSTLSNIIFRTLHHEPIDFSIEEPVLENITGPLASANEALPHSIFFLKPEWNARLKPFYEWDSKRDIRYFSALSYPATGGISRTLPLPHALYRLGFAIDLALSRALPKLTAFFFTVTLTRKATIPV